MSHPSPQLGQARSPHWAAVAEIQDTSSRQVDIFTCQEDIFSCQMDVANLPLEDTSQLLST